MADEATDCCEVLAIIVIVDLNAEGILDVEEDQYVDELRLTSDDADVVPGGSLDNLEHVSPFVDWSPGLSRVDRILLADAQTSGGLLVAVAPIAFLVSGFF